MVPLLVLLCVFGVLVTTATPVYQVPPRLRALRDRLLGRTHAAGDQAPDEGEPTQPIRVSRRRRPLTETGEIDPEMGDPAYDSPVLEEREVRRRGRKKADADPESTAEVSAVDLTVDMASVSSDRSQRDGQFRGRIMDVSTYPTATFKLSSPIKLPSVPSDNTVVNVNATGELTLHGTTKTVTVAIKAQRSGASVNVNGSIPIHFPDYNIDNPSGGPASVGDDGELEFLVVFAKS